MFARLARLIRGWFSMGVTNLENRNPAALLEDLRDRLNQAKIRFNSTTATIIAREKIAAAKLKSTRTSLEDCRRLILEAKTKNNRELALQLLIQEENLEASLQTAETAYTAIKQEADKAKADFETFQAETFQKMSQIEQLKTQADLANLKREMNNLRSNYATDTSGQINEELQKAGEIIQGRLAKEEAISELGQNSIDGQIRDLRSSAAKSRAEEKLAALFGEASASEE